MSQSNAPTRIVFALTAVALLITAAVLYAGPLNPPAGPITSTYKTLQEVEPRIALNATNTPGSATAVFRITTAGSYYLTGNLAVPLGKSGIEIAANNVTIDLMGYNIQAVLSAVKGITDDLPHNNLTVRNGTVTGFPQGGIFLNSGPSTTGVLVERVHASGNAGVGIFVGDHAIVSNCTAANNGSGGIRAGSNSTITGCSVAQNSFGILVGDASTITGCSAVVNTVQGFVTGDGVSFTNCTSKGNLASGFQAGSGSTLINCSSNNNAFSGIAVSFGSTVSNCSANLNLEDGINATAGSTVTDCSVRLNGLDGIQCSSSCVIRGNTCSSNGNGGDGAGIHANNIGNRIEGNNCTGSDRGIDVDLNSNVIIRNICSRNTTDWAIAGNNIFGPIIDRRVPASAAVNGFSAASTLGSTDPNANFSY